ncbi:helicase HerA-like domain-containing protein, partial [Rhizobium sp.]|uniref:helicase HerA-like domain-containing protein n=1 Tax=Rhizobium sp. TaxID=391 RepID=UPI0038998B70
VFMADVKGDLAGMAAAGGSNAKVDERVKSLGLEGFEYRATPVMFWDVFGDQGHPLRATVSEMGPLLLARVLDLNETQAGVLAAVFKIADDSGLLLLDLKDLRSMLQYAGDNASQFRTQYGNISTASVGAIQRGLLTLESQGGAKFFGEPALSIDDLMQTDGGRGVVSILAADKLLASPKVYSTLLLWLLSELFENLPEVGDPDKPKLVFFFDEAHLLFNDAPKVLTERVEQVVRLIRSKGVGVYFVTQNPLDVPETVLAQLGNRAQHALRAYSPREQKAVRTAADTFRANPAFDCATVITNLGTGEALVSTLEAKGAPSIVERTLVRPPSGRVGPVTDDERRQIMDKSPVLGVYDEDVDRESAFELLAARAKKTADAEAAKRAQEEAPPQQSNTTSGWNLPGFGGGNDDDNQSRGQSRGRASGYQRETVVEAAMKSVARTVATQVGRALVRGILGSLKR